MTKQKIDYVFKSNDGEYFVTARTTGPRPDFDFENYDPDVDDVKGQRLYRGKSPAELKEVPLTGWHGFNDGGTTYWKSREGVLFMQAWVGLAGFSSNPAAESRLFWMDKRKRFWADKDMKNTLVPPEIAWTPADGTPAQTLVKLGKAEADEFIAKIKAANVIDLDCAPPQNPPQNPPPKKNDGYKPRS